MSEAIRMEAYYNLYGYKTPIRKRRFENENSIVSSLVSKDEVQAAEIDEFVEKKFEGSLPAFIAAFTKHQKISSTELDEVQRMIDRYRKEGTQ